MEDGPLVPITLKSAAGPSVDNEMPQPEELAPETPRCSPHIRVKTRVKLQLDRQWFVKVSTKIQGLFLVEPFARLYENRLCLAAAGVAEVSPYEPLNFLIYRIGPSTDEMKPKKIVAMAEIHPYNLVESHISHAEMLGPILDNPNSGSTKYRKINFN